MALLVEQTEGTVARDHLEVDVDGRQRRTLPAQRVEEGQRRTLRTVQVALKPADRGLIEHLRTLERLPDIGALLGPLHLRVLALRVADALRGTERMLVIEEQVLVDTAHLVVHSLDTFIARHAGH